MNRDRLVTTAAILSTALAPSAANAAVPKHDVLMKPTTKEQTLNRLVKRDVRILGRRILEGPVNMHGGDRVSTGADGKQIDTRTVTVAAPNPKGGGTGQYSFSVTAPLSSTGIFESKKATAVVVAEGYQIAPDYSLSPFVSLEYVKNQQTGTWAVRGDYQTHNQAIGIATIEAAVTPELSHEAHLTRRELGQFTLQSNQIIGDALHLAPVSLRQPAFHQPPGTQLNPLK